MRITWIGCLDAPTGLTATPGNGSAALSFTPPSATESNPITGYEVSTDNSSSWSTLTTAAGAGGTRTGAVTGLTNGVTYQVRVRAVNVVGAGTASTAASVTPAAVAPGSPTGLVMTPHNGAAALSFTPPGDTGGSAITGYEVSTDNGGSWSALTTSAGAGGTRTGAVMGLTNGVTYQVRVRAVNVVGAGSASCAVSVPPRTVPGVPTGLAATPGDASATLSFTAPGDTGGSAITKYEVST
ncbi:MAG: fibronectin type III domain-containing protein, partial [Dactylosporangium sp.]|nr:fibronectin type III domain-containing protein [Dactylosporangium sp.]